MDAKEMAYLCHEARLKIAEEYRLGLHDRKHLNGVMIRLIVQSLYDEHAQELELRDKLGCPPTR